MTGLLVLIAASTLGVEAGWQPLAEGGHEYTIQIEPSLVRLLQSGNDLLSEVPPQVSVRRFRVTIGTGALARVDGPTAAPRDDTTDNAIAAPSGPPARTDELSADRPAKSDSPANEMRGPAIPAQFKANVAEAQPLATKPAETGQPQPHSTEKPQLATNPVASLIGETDRPWLPFLIAAVLLACSLGANLYLGWIAWDARSRYRDAVSKLRAAPAG